MSSVKHAVETMNFAHGMLDRLMGAIPAEKALYQAHPTGNHVLWTMGHLACTYWWLSTTIDGAKAPALPAEYNGLFGQASKASADGSKYPSAAEVKRVYDAAYAGYLKLVEGLSESEAWSPCAIDTGKFASSKIDGAYKCAWHDGWHVGQIADLRRALGLPPVMG